MIQRGRANDGIWIAVGIAAVQLLLHALTNGNYGIFRDELYYLDCAKHLDWGYVDQPPLSIWLLAAARALFGDSVHAIRLLSELAGAATVVISSLIAKEMGGGRLAQAIAALAVALAPGSLVLSGFFSMNAFDLVIWALLAWILVRLSVRHDPQLWLWFGLVAGVGLLNKVSVLFLGFGVAVALVLTPLRRDLSRWQPYAGAALAGLIFMPYVIWNAGHDWATLEFMANAKKFKIAAMSPADFFGEQMLAMSPPLAPLWLGGLLWLLVPRWGGRYRALGWTFLAVFGLLVALKVKPYYLFPIYAMLFAAGGCAVESLLTRWRGRTWTVAATVAVLWVLLSGILTIPLAIPVLSPDGFLRYQATLGMGPKHYENNPVGAMPQYFSDRFGWQNMASAVAGVYESVPEEEKGSVLIFGGNYGEAGAINYFGPDLGLPGAVSTHNNHFLWGPEPVDAEPKVAIVIGIPRERLEALFEHVDQAATVTTTYGMPYENDLPVFVARGLKVSLEEIWHQGKTYI